MSWMDWISAQKRSIGNFLISNDPRIWHTGNHGLYGNPHPQYLSEWDTSYTPYQPTVTGAPYYKFATISIAKKTFIVNYRYSFELETLLWASNKPARMILDVRVDLASNGSYTVDGMLRMAHGDTYYPVQQTQVGYVASTNTATDLVLDLYIFFNKAGSQLFYRMLTAKNLFPAGNAWFGVFKYSAWRGVKLYDDTQPITFDNTTAGFVKFDRQVAFNTSIATTDTYTKRDNGNSLNLGDPAQWMYANSTDLWQPLGVIGKDGSTVLQTNVNFAGAAADYTLSAAEKVRELLFVTNNNAASNIIAPAERRWYWVDNTTAFAVTIKKSAGTGIAIGAGKRALVYYNGTDYARLTADV